MVEEANKLTAPSELLGIYRKFGDYPVSQHGAQALWGRETMAGMADGGLAAYGMPSFGIGASGHGRDYRLGYGLTVAQGGAMHFDLGVYANRRVWARELRSTALEAGSPRAGRDGSQAVTPAAGGAPKVLQSIVSRAGGGRRQQA